MSQQLISRSSDLKRLRDEGYDVALSVSGNYLLLRHVPYVNSSREVKFGTLVSELTVAGDCTTTPSTHVVHLAGEYPCNADGSRITKIEHQSETKTLDSGLVTNHSFSSKPAGGYRDFYDKMTTYERILSGPAWSIDPTVTAKTFPVIEAEEVESVFNYIDTASSRAEINLVTRKLELKAIAIVGLGGTGSYVLDLVAKTPVKEIHLFDADKFSQHNAFRSPGASSIEELREERLKVDYFKDRYSRMHRHLVTHPYHVDVANVNQLREMTFVFLCMDRGVVKEMIVEALESSDIPFIDVGMGLTLVDDSLIGVLRITTSTTEMRGHVRARQRIPFIDAEANNEYARNIQIADLNALNAALAVIKWKKLFGFYVDLEHEHFSTYTVDGNCLTNEERP